MRLACACSRKPTSITSSCVPCGISVASEAHSRPFLVRVAGLSAGHLEGFGDPELERQVLEPAERLRQRAAELRRQLVDGLYAAIGELEPAGPEEAERLDRVAGELAALRDVVAAVRDAAGGEGTAGERAGRGLDAAAGAAALLPPPWGTVAAAVLGAAGVGLTWLRGRGQVGRVLEAAGEVVRSWDVAAAQDPSAAEAIERAKPYLRAAQGAEARRLVARAKGKAA